MNLQISENLQLSVAERVQLVKDIWDIISSTPEELPLSEAEKAELDKRLASYQQNLDDEISWETLNNI